jgi:VWFA-related protein
MKKFIKINIKITLLHLLFSLCILLIHDNLQAKPYLTIDKADAESEFPKVRIFLTVRDLDKSIDEDLDERNLTIYEDNFSVNYSRVKNLSDAEGIVYIVMGVDSSKSISAKILKDLKKSASEFLNQPGKKDKIALYRFNDEAVLLNNFTDNKDELINKISSIQRHGKKTLLYNALYNSIELLNKIDITRKAVLVFTDGKDEGSSIELNDVIEYSRNSRIPIYCVAFNPKGRIKTLSRLSMLTGGRLFTSDKNDIQTIYKTIISSAKSQYLLEYKSILEPDGQSHNLEIKLRYGNIRDSEQIKINYKKGEYKFFFRMPSFYEAVIIALVLIFIILLIVLIIFFISHHNKIHISSSNIQTASPVVETGDNYKKTETDLLKGDPAEQKEQKTDEKISVKAWLVERDGANAGKKILIEYEEVTLGRGKDNRIILDDKSVSKKHAKIKLIKNSFYLFDMVSDKGTFLNENKLLRPKLLYDWDEIRLGKKVFIFRVSHVA